MNDFNATVPSSGTSTLKKQTLKTLSKKGLAKQHSKETEKARKMIKTTPRTSSRKDGFLILLKALDRVDFEDWKT